MFLLGLFLTASFRGMIPPSSLVMINERSHRGRESFWPQSNRYYENYIRRLNSRNITIRDEAMMGYFWSDKGDTEEEEEEDVFDNNQTLSILDLFQKAQNNKKNDPRLIILLQERNRTTNIPKETTLREKRRKSNANGIPKGWVYDTEIQTYRRTEDLDNDDDMDSERESERDSEREYELPPKKDKDKKSESFEVIQRSTISFKDIGGYDNIKKELSQCVDILVNYKKYSKYNVRIPRGIVLEGPPGNGKTLLAKGFAGETKTSFIPVSGAQFQEKYIGVGATRVRELFQLAKKNVPCIIFIDEIDAIGRRRSSDGESSSSERDSTLNELLTHLDGFKTESGIFLMGATNRADLLDPALTRPGRIDKKIFIGPPDAATREAILHIHLKGKPYDLDVKDMVDRTTGLSGAQIENLLNEGMLNALRSDRHIMDQRDIDLVMNKVLAGWQPNEHQFTTDMLERICIHEMGHAIVGYLSKHHSKLSKVIINLSSPTSPGYTLFETSLSNIYKREALFEHLMILLAGRIAEEVFYDVSTTTGAINDFEEALKLANKMIVYYGMGSQLIYPSTSEKYKERIDDEVIKLINEAYKMSTFLVKNSKKLVGECAEVLKRDKILKMDRLKEIIEDKYPEVLNLHL